MCIKASQENILTNQQRALGWWRAFSCIVTKRTQNHYAVHSVRAFLCVIMKLTWFRIIAIGCMELFRSWKNTNGVMVSTPWSSATVTLTRAQSPSFGALLVLSGILRALEIMLTVKRKVTTHKRTGSRAADGSNWSAAVSIVCPPFSSKVTSDHLP